MKMWTVVVMLGVASAASADDAKKWRLEGHNVIVEGEIAFETGNAKLKPESDAALQAVASYLAEKKAISTLRVEAHTDDQGDAKAMEKLTVDRALAVAKKLVALGADCKRLIAVGFGGTKPVQENATPAGRAANRRVVFVNAGMMGRAIGGMPLDGGGIAAKDVCAP